MQIVVSVRQGEISDRLREEVEERFERLSRFEPRISRVEVALSREKNWWEVESRATVHRAEPVHARVENPDIRTAVDEVADKMARQLKRVRSRHVDHQASPRRGSEEVSEVSDVPEELPEEEEAP